MRDSEYFAHAAFGSGIRNDHEVLEDDVQELAALYEAPAGTIRLRFHRFLDVYHRQTAEGTAEEWAKLHTGDLEHSFIRISKPYRFKSAVVVPEVLRIISNSLRSRSERPSLLDFGGGFGNDAIVYARSGLDVHYADLVSLRNTDVVARRFAARRLAIPIHDVGDLPDRRFDVITAIDVFEHLYDVEETAARLTSRIPNGGLLCCVNAFSAVTHDGDHLDKNRVYLELFGPLMDAAGFEPVEANTPVEAYRRVRDPEPSIDAEISRLRPALYEATRLRARQRCELLLNSLAGSPNISWTDLPVERASLSRGPRIAENKRRSRIGRLAYNAAAKRAPRSLKRAVWRQGLADKAADLSDTREPARALGALADWVAVLRIAEQRLAALGADSPDIGEESHQG